jgi:tRNA modification GTPase
MREPAETIVAIATPNGRGGIGVVRVSGGAARAIAQTMCGVELQPRKARLVEFREADDTVIDRGIAMLFPAPHSFTGEDVLELHAHGSPIVLDALVRRVCEQGARPARAGEFSERAFLNGKLDLAQAEAVADLIAARSEAQARAASRSLEGVFSRRVESLVQTIVHLRVEVEAAIDFSEDASESASLPRLERLFATATEQFDALLAAASNGARLTRGTHAVIAGAPNAGKSSLLNALAGNDRAIVTDIPGTTRDVLRESVVFDGVEITLADTAGLRESTDTVEGEGIRRARAELARADLVLIVMEHGGERVPEAIFAEVPENTARIVVANKIDLDGGVPSRMETGGVVTIALSARTGAGVGLLREELKRIAAGDQGDSAFSARGRHVLALERAGSHLASARSALATSGPELVAEDLRAVQQALAEITGVFTSEDLLGAIFSTFCIGK